jgi:transposase InsO family protein
MAAGDVQETVEEAIAKINLTHIKVRHRPRLLSDNGPAFIAEDLKTYLSQYRIKHFRGAPYHPMPRERLSAFTDQ